MKKAHAVGGALALVVLSIGAWWLQNRSDAALTLAGRVGVVGAAAASSAARGAAADGSGSVAVEVARVERLRIDDDALAVGTVRANQGVMLRPEVSGRIAKLAFADGQRVRRGQLLVQLDDTLQQAQLKQAAAQASIARTNLQRSRELVAQNFVSQSAVDQNNAALDVALAQVALAQAQVARMAIVAPFDGATGIRNVSVGDYVKDGADLVSIEDTSSVWIDFRLPERYLSRVRVGQTVEMSLDALPQSKFEARVEALDSQLDANGRSVLVRARLGNAGGALRGGMFARARVVFATRAQALVVPEAALVPLGTEQYVFKVANGVAGGKEARRVPARVGQRLPGKVELLDGVTEGDLVAVSGQGRLTRTGPQPVRIVDLSAPTATRGSP